MANTKKEVATNEATDTTKSGKELAVNETQGGALVAGDEFFDGAGDFGHGFEGSDIDSFSIPFIQILQKMSPVVDPDTPQYIDGARAGMFMNTVSKALHDGKQGITVIPCAFRRSFIEWGGRESAAPGFKGEHTPDEISSRVDSGELKVLNGRVFKPEADGTIDPKKSTLFADTRAHYIIAVTKNGEWARAILPLSSTQTKASKNLMTMLREKKIDVPGRGKQTPPTYANRVLMTTVGLSNEKGTWSGVQFKLDGLIDLSKDRALFDEARNFCKEVTGGTVKADFSRSVDDGENVHGEGSGSGTSADQF